MLALFSYVVVINVLAVEGGGPHYCEYAHTDPCQNGGTCNRYNSGYTYTCSCWAGYTGRHCEQIDCVCQNGGTCNLNNEGTGYTCSCADGWTGTNCEQINCTSSVYCKNGGTCSPTNGGTGYTCSCADGWMGSNCEDIDCSSSRYCQNGGTCNLNNEGTGYTCSCADGWTGPNCEQINCTSSVYCKNGGTCSITNGGTGYTCSCAEGWKGNNCEDIDCTSSAYCKNGGTCSITNGGSGYTCSCAEGWKGNNCEDIDCSSSLYCRNGGTCNLVNAGTGYTCFCADGWMGSNCEQIDCTSSRYCHNGGTCNLTNGGTGYTCSCSNGWTGRDCNHRSEIVQEVAKLREELQHQRHQIQELMTRLNRKSSDSGSSYVRWGRTTCPRNGSEAVYSGYMGTATDSRQVGTGSNYLCLTSEPQWDHYEESIESLGKIAGVEYQFWNHRGNGASNFFGYDVYNDNAPCTVCHINRGTNIMIPGRMNCYAGWTKEYTGYLVSGFVGQSLDSEFICLDRRPETVAGGKTNDDGATLYFVDAVCGKSLKCPPYIQGRELTCVVCSK